VRARLIEIGEAAKDLDPDLLVQQPHIPWRQVAAMRDQRTHRYFDSSHAIVEHTAVADVPKLTAAVQALLDRSPPPA
jgi:uncharacterized protein with HEPN domain